MNKFLITLIILFASTSLLQAQQKYVRAKKDFKDGANQMQFFKDEIYVLDREDGNGKKYFTANGKICWASASVEILQRVQNREADKNTFIKQNKDEIRLDLTSITDDTVWLASDTKKVAYFADKKTGSISLHVTGDKFRLIIPNTLTVWYDKNELEDFGKNELAVLYDENSEKKENRYEKFLIGIFITVAVLLLLTVIRNRKTIRAILSKRISGNKNKSSERIVVFDDSSTLAVDKARMEEQLRAKNSEISRLYQEKSNLTVDKARLEEQLRAKNSEINLLQQEKIKWDSKYVSLSEYTELEKRYNSLNKKIVPVDYLHNNSEIMLNYFSLCKEIEQKAGNYYNKIVLRYDYNAAITACLLQQFRNNVRDLPTGDWRQIVSDINETGVTANKRVIRILSQPSTESEKQREFRKTLFREVVVPYSSSILILAESFRNLARFGIDSVFADEASLDFEKYIIAIMREAKTIDMEIKYVPLFKKFDSFSAKVESVNKNKSFPYSEVRNLQRDDIAEIVSCGVKTEFEDIKTQIIIE
jgi:hypothetical protein